MRGCERPPRAGSGSEHARVEGDPTKNAVGSDLAAVVELDHEEAELRGVALVPLEVNPEAALGTASLSLLWWSLRLGGQGA